MPHACCQGLLHRCTCECTALSQQCMLRRVSMNSGDPSMDESSVCSIPLTRLGFCDSQHSRVSSLFKPWWTLQTKWIASALDPCAQQDSCSLTHCPAGLPSLQHSTGIIIASNSTVLTQQAGSLLASYTALPCDAASPIYSARCCCRACYVCPSPMDALPLQSCSYPIYGEPHHLKFRYCSLGCFMPVAPYLESNQPAC